MLSFFVCNTDAFSLIAFHHICATVKEFIRNSYISVIQRYLYIFTQCQSCRHIISMMPYHIHTVKI